MPKEPVFTLKAQTHSANDENYEKLEGKINNHSWGLKRHTGSMNHH